MGNIFENREKYKSAVGHFVMTFSELEFSLLYYCALIDHPRDQNYGIKLHLQSTFGQRRTKISNFIRSEIPELQITWDTINSKLGEVNRDRRFIVHGIGRASFFEDSIKTFIPNKDTVDLKDFSIESIKAITNKMSYLLTGDNGLTGEFLNKFSTARFDLHNKITLEDNKIIYRIGGDILTEFKG
jgi:hypothetical protein